ncbi:MAG: RDD family protein [Aquihabitans sp.]
MDFEEQLTLANAEGIDLDVSLAGIGSRGGALIIDVAVQTAALLLLGLLTSLLSVEVTAALVAVFGFLIIVGYPIVAEAFAGGRTLGKAALGIHVVGVDGSPVTFLAAVIRNLVRVIDLLPGTYLVGSVAVLSTAKNQRLGDLAANTIVVHRRSRSADITSDLDLGPAFAHPLLDSDPSGWDLSGVTAEEVAAVRSFLIRRDQLDPGRRADLAQTLAFQLLPKVAGVPLEGGPERFLERVVAARTAR